MRKTESLNNGWYYTGDFKDEYIGRMQGEPVNLPHTNKILPYNGFDEKDSQFISTYSRELFLSKSLQEKMLYIHFEGVMTACKVWLNGIEIGGHKGGYTPFKIQLNSHVIWDEMNIITVQVDSHERQEIPPFGKVIDFLTFGGIYREVSLEILNPLHLSDLKVETEKVLDEHKTVKAFFQIQTPESFSGKLDLKAQLSNRVGEILFEKDIVLEKNHRGEPHCLRMENLTSLELWDLDSPTLYNMELQLFRDSQIIDSLSCFLGFRKAEFNDKGFFLNNKLIRLSGLNRHQSYPYVGYAMPWRAQYKDADILKFDLGLNMVRTSHYPQSRHFLDRCDEIGLLVFEEIPGWQHIGDDQWRENACLTLQEMIKRDWNHPSIVLWGVRINESDDDHDFYSQTNNLAKELDPTRQTGGVRYFEKSELLEDVYTMNDFVHTGENQAIRNKRKTTGLKKVPYLISEHSGHMFPTKRFDQEERLQAMALRHLKILNAANGDPGISGAIGWCAFDYNTHREFGSGDRVCYHGVMDMFRIPKTTASAYSSQMSPDHNIVMEALSLFSKGERDAARILPIYVNTNCDYIKIFRNGKEIGDYYPACSDFPHLNHPPIIIKDLVGNQLENSHFSKRDQKAIKGLMSFVMLNGEEKLRWYHYLKIGWLMRKYAMKYADMVTLFLQYAAGWGEKEDIFQLAGFYKGREVIRKSFGSGHADKLTIHTDDEQLCSGDWDTTRIEIRLVDQYGNIMPYVNDFIELQLEGPAEVIGPQKTALIGGVISFWIKTNGEKGKIQLQGKCSRFSTEQIRIEVI